MFTMSTDLLSYSTYTIFCLHTVRTGYSIRIREVVHGDGMHLVQGPT